MTAQHIAYKHRPGDGLHFVTHAGDTSENCVLYTLHVVAFRFGLPPMVDLWNTVYPDDQMSFNDSACIIASAVQLVEPFAPDSPDDVSSVIEDLEAIGCHELAAHSRVLLRNKGAAI